MSVVMPGADGQEDGRFSASLLLPAFFTYRHHRPIRTVLFYRPFPPADSRHDSGIGGFTRRWSAAGAI